LLVENAVPYAKMRGATPSISRESTAYNQKCDMIRNHEKKEEDIINTMISQNSIRDAQVLIGTWRKDSVLAGTLWTVLTETYRDSW
jgi:hypothetical protein